MYKLVLLFANFDEIGRRYSDLSTHPGSFSWEREEPGDKVVLLIRSSFTGSSIDIARFFRRKEVNLSIPKTKLQELAKLKVFKFVYSKLYDVNIL